MNSTFQERQKAEAVERLRLMGVQEEYIRDFEQNDQVPIFVEDGITLKDLSPHNIDAIRYLQDNAGTKVYLVVRTTFGDLDVVDTLFIVHQFEDRWSEDKECVKKGYAMSLTMSCRHGGFTEFGLTVFRRLPDGRIVREK